MSLIMDQNITVLCNIRLFVGKNCMYLVFAMNESLERTRSFCKAHQMVCPKFAPDLNNYSFSVCESLVT